MCVYAWVHVRAPHAHTCLFLFFVGAEIWGVGKAKHDHGSVIKLARKNWWEVLRIIKFLPKVHGTILTNLQIRSYLVKHLESKKTFWHNWHNLSLQLFNFAFNNDKSIMNMHHFNPNPAIYCTFCQQYWCHWLRYLFNTTIHHLNKMIRTKIKWSCCCDFAEVQYVHGSNWLCSNWCSCFLYIWGRMAC